MADAPALRKAARTLRESLDPEVTPHERYERLMLDLAWPLNLATLLDQIAAGADDVATAADVVARAISRAAL